MKRIRSALLLCLAISAAACAALPGGTAAAATQPAAASCRAVATTLREHLESVTEAVIDGRPAAVPGATDRVVSWWSTHCQSLGSRIQADSLINLMTRAALRHRTREAARVAVQLSVQSLGWCPGTPGTDERLMLVDLTGMAGWLRARGERLEWPGDVQSATDSLASALVARRHRSLAAQLSRAVAATLSTPESPSGDVRTAVRLLDLVDVIEKVLR